MIDEILAPIDRCMEDVLVMLLGVKTKDDLPMNVPTRALLDEYKKTCKWIRRCYENPQVMTGMKCVPADRRPDKVPDCLWAYWGIVWFMFNNAGGLGQALSEMERRRERLHDELCLHYGITKDASRKITDNMNEYEDVVGVHEALEEK